MVRLREFPLTSLEAFRMFRKDLEQIQARRTADSILAAHSLLHSA
jgi:hypothetical protein